MKKLFLVIICLVLFFSLSACGSDNQETDSNSPTDESKMLSEQEFVQMYSDPKSFKGDGVEFYAQVFMPVERDEDGIYIQAYADPKNMDMNMIIGIKDSNIDVEDGDIIYVKGEVFDEFVGENAFGATLSMPQILADTIEKADYSIAFAPAIHTINIDDQIDQHGYVLTISKIEIAESETRIFVDVTNNTKDSISFYTFNMRLIQENKQFEEEMNYEADYPEPQSDLLPGISTEGVITFPPINPDLKEAKIVFEGHSDNWELDFEPFVFEVTWE